MLFTLNEILFISFTLLAFFTLNELKFKIDRSNLILIALFELGFLIKGIYWIVYACV